MKGNGFWGNVQYLYCFRGEHVALHSGGARRCRCKSMYILRYRRDRPFQIEDSGTHCETNADPIYIFRSTLRSFFSANGPVFAENACACVIDTQPAKSSPFRSRFPTQRRAVFTSFWHCTRDFHFRVVFAPFFLPFKAFFSKRYLSSRPVRLKQDKFTHFNRMYFKYIKTRIF